MAAIAAAGVATSMAQVYSVNAVGYVNVALKKGFNQVANPLNNGDNKLGTILPAVPDGTQVYTFTSGKFDDAVEFIEGFGWSDANKVLAPGTGAFVSVNADASVTFVGEVAQGDVGLPLVSGYQLISSKVPIEASLASTGNNGMNFPAADGDQVYFFVNGAFEDAREFIEGFGWSATEPTPKVAGSFFLFTKTARAWARTFTIQP